MSTLTIAFTPAVHGRPGSFVAAIRGTCDTWWQRARQRRQLAALSDRQLADIGVSREAARREAAKPFWQP